ncbi:hypothetical protein M0K47_000825 [Escherichia coli]|uniref:hypothetical protein n=1 Tax=Escherichia coli TaxID=562 RepID=UPI00192B599C|nr:hypothetical protein [Escherichia coli]EKX8147971.1 hypothetical protein [Escherichia coli]MCI3551978.1 hypothetical protein [Escherichia coli]MCJ8490808.1 hypothetical protein [Escherichia coli]MCM2848317.1 hypothetical protein [Escherichia coli]HBA5018748.1 hypothetical protein [Escherichia coli]
MPTLYVQRRKNSGLSCSAVKKQVENLMFYEYEVYIYFPIKSGQTLNYGVSKTGYNAAGQNEKYYPAKALYNGTGKVSYFGCSSKIQCCSLTCSNI